MATRRHILRSAAEMFDRLGFDGSSLNVILDNAGITKGSLYFHFKSKDDLAQVIVDQQHAVSIAAVDAIANSEASAVEQIVMLCHEMGRQMVEDPVVRAGIRLTIELSAADGPAAPYVDWIRACQSLVVGGIAEGDIVDTLDPLTLARFIISAFTGVQLVSNVLAARTDLERRIDEMWVLLLPSIMSPHRRRKIEKIRQARWRPEQYASANIMGSSR